jgi:hypothetical protein
MEEGWRLKGSPSSGPTWIDDFQPDRYRGHRRGLHRRLHVLSAQGAYTVAAMRSIASHLRLRLLTLTFGQSGSCSCPRSPVRRSGVLLKCRPRPISQRLVSRDQSTVIAERNIRIDGTRSSAILPSALGACALALPPLRKWSLTSQASTNE